MGTDAFARPASEASTSKKKWKSAHPPAQRIKDRASAPHKKVEERVLKPSTSKSSNIKNVEERPLRAA